MKLRCNLISAGLGVLLLLGASRGASAARVYLLVGSKHIYLLGDDPTLYQEDREEIEKTYADLVASDMATSASRIAAGASAADENQQVAADMAKLAEDREECLDELYEKRDDLRDIYPDFKQIDMDAPYQVLQIEYHGGTESQARLAAYREPQQQATIDNITVLAPWPGFEPGEQSFGGWVYNQKYTSAEFFESWRTWRSRRRGRVSIIAFRTHEGEMPFKNGRFVGKASDYVMTTGYAHERHRLKKKGVIKRRRRRRDGG